MGALAPGSAHARPSAQAPIKQVYGRGVSIFSPFQAILSVFHFSEKNLKNRVKTPCKISEPYVTGLIL